MKTMHLLQKRSKCGNAAVRRVYHLVADNTMIFVLFCQCFLNKLVIIAFGTAQDTHNVVSH